MPQKTLILIKKLKGFRSLVKYLSYNDKTPAKTDSKIIIVERTPGKILSIWILIMDVNPRTIPTDRLNRLSPFLSWSAFPILNKKFDTFFLKNKNSIKGVVAKNRINIDFSWKNNERTAPKSLNDDTNIFILKKILLFLLKENQITDKGRYIEHRLK